MTVPPRIRVNVAAPFPSLVTGAGPISIGKQNGIWTVGMNGGALGQQVPTPPQFATDYVLVWDSVAQQMVSVSLNNVNPTGVMGGLATNVNFNSANSDTAITITTPRPTYRFGGLFITSPSGALNISTWGLFSGAGGTGTAIFAAGQPNTITTAAANTNNNYLLVANASANTQSFNFTTLFFRVGTPQGVAATATVMIHVNPLP